MPKKSARKSDPATEKFIKDSVRRKRVADKNKKQAKESAVIKAGIKRLHEESMRDSDYRERHRRGADIAAARKEVNDKMRKLKNDPEMYKEGNTLKFRKARTKALSEASKAWGVSKDEIKVNKWGSSQIINPAKEIEKGKLAERKGTW